MGSGLQALVIGVVALLGSLAVWKLAGPPERLRDGEVYLSTVQEEWGGEVLWVDARKRSEWKKNGLAGSVLISLEAGEDFESLVAEAIEKFATAERVVVYCGSRGCSTGLEVAAKLEEFQLGPRCYSLHGGVQTLIDAGLINDSK
jgi:rhodanese-related sulfurtransferase